jgi:hypothetical protein
MQFLANLYASYAEPTLHHTWIAVHVTAALFALVIAPLAMVTRKGGLAHRRWGKAYFWGMFITNGSALILLAWRFNIFLLGVTVLSFYGAFTGYRAIYWKRPLKGAGPTWLDRGATWVVLAAGVALFAWGIVTALGLTRLWIPNNGGTFAIFVILPLLFGAAIATDAITDLRIYRAPSTDCHWWWYYHMERMLGSYIALLTALMVQQVGPSLPGSFAWVVWVVPAMIGTPAISYWIVHYRRKFAKDVVNGSQDRRKLHEQPAQR